MAHPNNRERNLIMVWLFLFTMLTACTSSVGQNLTPTPQGIFEIDPLLHSFYQSLGDRNTLGPGISPLIDHGDRYCQYTENAYLCVDSNKTGRDRYSLWPVSADLGYTSTISTELPGINVEIFPDFFSSYQNLGGPAVLGFPLTNPQENPEGQRIEQIFEYIGFYRFFNEPEGTVHLLPLGKWHCGLPCKDYQIDPRLVPSLPDPTEIPAPNISSLLGALGGEEIFGETITIPYPTSGGEIEQGFKNVFAYTQHKDPGIVYLKPISRIIGMPSTSPSLHEDIPVGMVPVRTSGDLGYLVPEIFDQFITSHGGYALSGPPIMEPTLDGSTGNIRQCFENLCIDFNSTAMEQPQLVALGQIYLDITSARQNRPKEIDSVDLEIILSEAQPQISPEKPQHIYILVFKKGTREGVQGVTAIINLLLNQPGTQLTTSPTDQAGRTEITIPPIPGVLNGMVIPYEVCITSQGVNAICRQDSFLVWED